MDGSVAVEAERTNGEGSIPGSKYSSSSMLGYFLLGYEIGFANQKIMELKLETRILGKPGRGKKDSSMRNVSVFRENNGRNICTPVH